MLALIATLLAQSCSAPFVCIDGDQVIGNSKVFTGLLQAYGNYNYNGESVSLAVVNGMRLGGQLAPLLDGNSIVLRGRRLPGDVGAGVVITSEHPLDAGGYLAVNGGDVTHAQLLVLDWMGNLMLSPAPLDNGSEAPDILHRGMLVSRNWASGARVIQSAPGAYLVVEYRMAEQCAQLADGGRPTPDGGTEVQCFADGGCCVAYAGRHGGFTSISSVPQWQGWLHETANPGVYGGASKFIVHATGAFGPANGLMRSEFPTCPSPLAYTSLGQFYPGVPPGVFIYAADEDQHYRCKLTGWEPL